MNKVDLSTIGSGVLNELFEEDFQKILENIADENTSAKATRELTLKIKIVPHENRADADVHISSSTRLAPVKPFSGILFFGRRGGRVEAFQNDATQPEIPGMERGKLEAVK